jgi:adenine-specific DNA methylase
MISNAMYAILRFASLFSAQQFVTMTVFLRLIAHASKSRTIETIVETSSQNVFNAQFVRKQTTTQFDSKDLIKKIAKYVFFVRNI